MTARRKRQKRQLFGSRKRTSINWRLIILLLSILLIIFGFFYIRKTTKLWDGERKISVIAKDGNDLKVLVFDPVLSEIIIISIPGNTRVEVSRNLGKWDVKSLWQLGNHEGLGGLLAVETLTRNFFFPSDGWADEKFLALASGDLFSSMKLLIAPVETNLGRGDILNMIIFSTNISNKNRINIDLSETSYIRREMLLEGEEGYLLTGKMPGNLKALFSDPQISSKQTKFVIKNYSGNRAVNERIAKLVEVLGGKVVSLEDKEAQGFDCYVAGVDKIIVQKLSMLLICEERFEESTSFDIEIGFGTNFVERY